MPLCLLLIISASIVLVVPHGLMDGLWYSLRLVFCRLLLVGSLVIVVVVLNSGIGVLQMLSIVEMWLECAGPLTR